MKNIKIEEDINIKIIRFLKFFIFLKILKYFLFFKIKSKIILRVMMHSNNIGKPVTDLMWGPSDLLSAVWYVIIDNIRIKINRILDSFDIFLYLKKFKLIVSKPDKININITFVALAECWSDEKGSG